MIIPASVNINEWVPFDAFAGCDKEKLVLYVVPESSAHKWALSEENEYEFRFYVSYAIKYQLNGGINSLENPVSYVDGDDFELREDVQNKDQLIIVK